MCEVIVCLRVERSAPRERFLSLWCGSDSLSDEWFAFNDEYWAKDIYFEVCRPRRASQYRNVFVRWHFVEVFDIPPQCRGEVFVAVWLWWAYYQASRLLYVSSAPVLALFSAM